ncbi:hypothetical protein TrVE_jg4059 [Triparma verrucosa]|uniref:Uncharacterized protein n=1 Tax=Triparma verrucosa TaxID=1606542 RepID=A0A9W7BE97_9STRA|nr:hypothetical protein TrVE_jg4059 [Triparma verrucosa]
MRGAELVSETDFESRTVHPNVEANVGPKKRKKVVMDWGVNSHNKDTPAPTAAPITDPSILITAKPGNKKYQQRFSSRALPSRGKCDTELLPYTAHYKRSQQNVPIVSTPLNILILGDSVDSQLFSVLLEAMLPLSEEVNCTGCNEGKFDGGRGGCNFPYGNIRGGGKLAFCRTNSLPHQSERKFGQCVDFHNDTEWDVISIGGRPPWTEFVEPFEGELMSTLQLVKESASPNSVFFRTITSNNNIHTDNGEIPNPKGENPLEWVARYNQGMRSVAETEDGVWVLDDAKSTLEVVADSAISLNVSDDEYLEGPLVNCPSNLLEKDLCVKKMNIPMSFTCSRSTLEFPESKEYGPNLKKYIDDHTLRNSICYRGGDDDDYVTFGYPSEDGMHFCEPIIFFGWIEVFVDLVKEVYKGM